ncbi:coenzyme Q-binding protein COQ10 homolog A, mitochondrial [Pararge aegeria]|uniref:Jg8448 protein n=1 Tax=Pararge aegeria aegeria TaxID=348720 RepID=A0A8S4S0R0_9NEOP|nr:coenzyme Q-binding protein COQ10 homolog A, mitochondrial [Pararge aegeria]CAH2244978.1 jg8448 [Pararge aegeria aegeria]
MILSKISYFIGFRAFVPAFRISRFQGHYVNNVHCQCHIVHQQRRSFFSFPKSSRKREYCGRQLVGYTIEQMYDVVSDVENYHKFVPWCKQSIVLTKTPNNLKADLIVGFPPINESYTSHVTLVKPYLVKAECTDGKLFHHLLTLWRFSSGLKREHQSCVVDFQIAFEFRSAFHSHLSNLFFDQVARQMEEAFVQEAGKRYGPASVPPRNLLQNGHAIKS